MTKGKPWRVRDAARNLKRARSKELQANGANPHGVSEKNWKHVYTRSAKIARARQLGFEYPRRSNEDAAYDDAQTEDS